MRPKLTPHGRMSMTSTPGTFVHSLPRQHAHIDVTHVTAVVVGLPRVWCTIAQLNKRTSAISALSRVLVAVIIAGGVCVS